MNERLSNQEYLAEVAKLLQGLEGEFIDTLDPIEPTQKTLLIQIFKIWRQVYLRRLVDLGTSAHFQFVEGRLVPGCTLTRGVFETVGSQFYVHKKLSQFSLTHDADAAHKLLGAALFGQKDGSFETTDPINVLKGIDHLNKEFNFFRAEYDHLSEYSHPNFKGSLGTYAYLHLPGLNAEFGLNPQKLEMSTWGLGSLHIALTIATELHNRIEAFEATFIQMVLKYASNSMV